MNEEIPLVSIICTTYNHEPYIRQTLEGFIMQQCDFLFEIIIHDDASTDKTAGIIREYVNKYPHLFNAILQTENQYSQGKDLANLLYIEKPRGKYIAICEGDDYWTDPLKLQKQIDFLEANFDYGMTYSKAICYLQKEGKQEGNMGKDYYSFENLLIMNVVPTLTVVMRKDLCIQYYNEIRPAEQHWLLGDFPMWLWFAKNSKLYYMDTSTGVYRILSESASKSSNPEKLEQFSKSCIAVQEYFVKYYNVTDFEIMQEIRFEKIWSLFNIACIFNVKRLFDEIKKEINDIQIRKKHVLYMKAVLFFRWLRYFLILFRTVQQRIK